jgi:hypothetical protein
MVHVAISVQGEVLPGSSLYAEIGSAHVALWTQARESNKVGCFYLFEFPATAAAAFPDLLAQLLQQAGLDGQIFRQVHVIWDTPESLVVPGEFAFHETAEAYLDTVFGETAGCLVYTQPVQDTAVVYRIPASWRQAVTALDPVTCTHKYQHLLHAPQEGISLILYRDYGILAAWHNNVLQCMRHVRFSTPEDILYHIKQADQVFGQAEYPVQLCGLLDTDSRLFKTLQLYIGPLSLNKSYKALLDKKALKAYPAHYFAHFITGQSS